ncbi:MAG: ABC transporter permease [Hyphomonas sp.]|uniref:ABC transporter permease n=1 Tax=unclassified Hyphomonas TaxID=2630699 RepID=UPI000DEDE679|nr:MULTISPECIES: ABC transporter permease [unclassified Hyphomonas]AXE64975.1 hypothetical protein BBF93_12620 [Hyphomonas sp. CACIAM 19H1]MBA4226173.1 ABC transporter permease [Hyphomonas sp.]
MILRYFIATFRAIRSDRPALLLLVVSTLLYSFFYPSAYSGEVATRMPVAVVDLDNSAASRSLALKAGAVQQAEVVAHLRSMPEARALMQDGSIDAIVLIPAGFADEVHRGGQGSVALYGNGAYLLRSSTALGGVAAALGAVGVEAATDQARMLGAPAAQPLTVISRPLFNTREGYGSSVVPGVVFVIVHQTLLMGLAMLAATLREKEGWVHVSPPGLLGIALAFFVLGAAQVAYFTGFVFWFQDYPRAGADIFALSVAGALFVSATVAGALALSSFFRSRERPLQIWILTSLPIYFLSGLSWPIEATPAPLVWLGKMLPTTPGINAMIGLNQMGASIGDIWPELANLLALTVVYGLIAVFRYGRSSNRFRTAIHLSPV